MERLSKMHPADGGLLTGSFHHRRKLNDFDAIIKFWPKTTTIDSPWQKEHHLAEAWVTWNQNLLHEAQTFPPCTAWASE